MTTARLILEGVSGSGKSSVLRRLRRAPEFRGALVLTERETFGELMDELRASPPDPKRFLRRLNSCLRKIENSPRDRACLIERFHLSYAALAPDWTLYRTFDRRLKELGFKLAVLHVPESALTRRSLDRSDRTVRWRTDMKKYFGGGAAALRALRLSQHRRISASRRTSLPCRIIDTRDRDWACATAALISFASSYPQTRRAPSL